MFKIFVANPHKEGRVLDVLLRNQQRLINFMSAFQTERTDEQFVEEKSFLVQEIGSLTAPTAPQPPVAGGSAQPEPPASAGGSLGS